MLKKILFSGRFTVLFHFLAWFIATSTIIRICLYVWQSSDVSLRAADVIRTFVTGFFFDFGTAVYICLPAMLYFVLIPNRLIGSRFDRIFVWFFTALTTFIFVFAFFAEFTFWEEFRSRFNFIAVDYLIYTQQ